jgi:hypothetical protein
LSTGIHQSDEGFQVYSLHFALSEHDNRVADCPMASETNQHRLAGPFQPGAIVIVTLHSPREKFWGAILNLSSQGLSVRGVDLISFDELISTIKSGDSFTSGVIFFPMHRVERMELDLPESNILSLSQRFAQQTGQDPAPLLTGGYLMDGQE